MQLTQEQLGAIADKAAQDCVEALPSELVGLLGGDIEGQEEQVELMNAISQAIVDTFARFTIS